MKKLLFLLLALPTLLTAQEKAVQVPTPCLAGNAFTIKIPVRFPENMTVQYAWYRNDTLVEDSHMLLLGEKTIAYTIPADKAFGSAVYYFKYMLHDKYDGKWTDSPHYVVTFITPRPPQASGISGYATVCANNGGLSYSVTYVANVTFTWIVPLGWTITNGQGTNSIMVQAGTEGGDMSVTLSNSGGTSEPRTLTVGITYIGCTVDRGNEGSISDLAIVPTCVGGVSNAGTISSCTAAAACNGGGVSNAGTITSFTAMPPCGAP